ncbi:MAG: hypothetical protein RMK93_08920 [Bacteroidota bacterium]|nr:hypothetical protein [Bacteroidota bacterium]
MGFFDGVGFSDFVNDAVSPGEIDLDAIYKDLFFVASERALVEESAQFDVFRRMLHV